MKKDQMDQKVQHISSDGFVTTLPRWMMFRGQFYGMKYIQKLRMSITMTPRMATNPLRARSQSADDTCFQRDMKSQTWNCMIHGSRRSWSKNEATARGEMDERSEK